MGGESFSKNKCRVVWPSHLRLAQKYYDLEKINVEWSGPLSGSRQQCADVIRANEIVIGNSKIGKMSSVVDVLKVFGINLPIHEVLIRNFCLIISQCRYLGSSLATNDGV